MNSKLAAAVFLTAFLARPALALDLISSADVIGSTTTAGDSADGAVLDPSGNLYVTGHVSASSTVSSLWVAKYAPGLALISSTTLSDIPAGNLNKGINLALDDSQNVYIVGTSPNDQRLLKFSSALVFVSSVALNVGPLGAAPGMAMSGGTLYLAGYISTAAWMGKYNASLALVSSAAYTPSANQAFLSVGLSPNGDLYAGGYISTGSLTAHEDTWLARINPSSLAVVSSRTIVLSAGQLDSVNGLKADGDGTIWAAGNMNSSGVQNAWLARFAADLSTLSQTTVPGVVCQGGQDIAPDGKGNVYLTGMITNSPSFAAPSLRAPFLAAGPDTDNLWVGRFDSSLQLAASALADGTRTLSSADTGLDVETDGNGKVYVAGLLSGATTLTDGWVGFYRDSVPAAPGETSAGRGYPNPFKPGQETMNLDRLPADASLRVYTPAGALVREIRSDANGFASWDGKNDAGETVSSGVYVILVESGGRSGKFKVVVQK